jgi:hypothetical protein
VRLEVSCGVFPTDPDPAGFTVCHLGRRFAAHLLDALVAFSVVLLAAIVMRGLRAFGLWMRADPGLTLEQTWKALRVIVKIFVIVAFVVSTGPI